MTGGNSLYFKLGLFMLVGVVLLAGGIIVLGAGKLFQEKIPAETLVYDSVNGLDVGSAVKYRGVPIGRVSGIIFASAKYGEKAAAMAPATGGKDVRGILIEIALTKQAFPGESVEQIQSITQELIAQGMRARVTPAGISGQSYVELDILDPNQFPPPPLSWKPDVLYVPSAPSPLGQVLDAAGSIATQLEQANLGKVVHHIDELTTQATSAVGNVNRLIDTNRDNLTHTLAALPETAARIGATASRADDILHDPRVEKGLNGFSSVGDSASAAIGDIRRLARDAEALLAGESDDLRVMIADLRRLASDGATLSDDARQNPSRLLFGGPPPHDRPSQPAR